MLSELSTLALVTLVFGSVVGATAIGALFARRVRHLSESLSEPFGVLQAAMLGVVGLILAFGLSLAVSRYEDRRAVIVDEANAIGTTYLRAQTLAEPVRSRSLDLLVAYADSATRLGDYRPGSEQEDLVIAEESRLQRLLWRQAGEALDAAPRETGPRLYLETLNEMIDAQTSRVAALANHVPGAVLWLEIIGASLALAMLAGYLALVGRGVGGAFLASLLVGLLLFVTADLDRPTRGLIKVPSSVLERQLESMRLPPAAAGWRDNAP